ncbi:hypothetical protein OTU49_012435, partial [Cherax quadricarinatus]
MICNSGLLITRKLKELVTGGDFSPNKRSTPVKAVTAKPVSAEPVPVYYDDVRPGHDPRPGHPLGGRQDLDTWENLSEVFESPSLVCGSLSESQFYSEPHYSSLSRPGKTQQEYTKLNGKTVRLYSSLPRASLTRGHSTQQFYAPTSSTLPPPPPPPPSCVPAKLTLTEDSASVRYVALSDIYAELPRKKKKPCTMLSCSSVHHRHHHNTAYNTYSNTVYSTIPYSKTNSNTLYSSPDQDKKFRSLEFSSKKQDKSKFFQKFNSLDRSWKSFMTPRTNCKKAVETPAWNYSDSSVITESCSRKGSRGRLKQEASRDTLNTSSKSRGFQPWSRNNHSHAEDTVQAKSRRPTIFRIRQSCGSNSKVPVGSDPKVPVHLPTGSDSRTHQPTGSDSTNLTLTESYSRTHTLNGSNSRVGVQQTAGTSANDIATNTRENVTLVRQKHSGGQQEQHNGGQQEQHNGGQQEQHNGGQQEQHNGGQQEQDNSGQQEQDSGSQQEQRSNGQQEQRNSGQQGGNDGTYQCHTLPKAHREVRDCHRSSNAFRSDKMPLATWEPFFCVLLQDETTFTAYRSEEMAIGDSLFYDLPRMRLDGGARAFRRRWGYELTPPPTLVEEEEENDEDPYSILHDDDNLSFGETRSLRDDYLFHSSQ